MPRIALTDRFVAGAKAGDVPQVDYFDEKTPGLALRVSRAGRRVWSFIFTSPRDGKRARITLGNYPATSLALARTWAIEARGNLDKGLDPRDVSVAHKDGLTTVAALVESYLDKHARPSLRSAAAIERRLNKNVVPMIGAVKLNELHRRDISRVVDPVLERGRPVEAARVFEDLRAVLRWGESRGDLDRNPSAGMKRPANGKPRERVLSDDELATLWSALPTALPRSKACQRIIKLCLLTGQRVGEVAGMTTSELDVATATWKLPPQRTKNGHEHVVPLPGQAIDVIEEALPDCASDSPYLFPDASGSGWLSSGAVGKTIRRAQQTDPERPLGRFGVLDWSAHDLRRTVVSGMAALGIAPIVLGHVINHRSVTRAGITLSVYSHYDYAREKREALERWAQQLVDIVSVRADQLVPNPSEAR